MSSSVSLQTLHPSCLDNCKMSFLCLLTVLFQNQIISHPLGSLVSRKTLLNSLKSSKSTSSNSATFALRQTFTTEAEQFLLTKQSLRWNNFIPFQSFDLTTMFQLLELKVNPCRRTLLVTPRRGPGLIQYSGDTCSLWNQISFKLVTAPTRKSLTNLFNSSFFGFTERTSYT